MTEFPPVCCAECGTFATGDLFKVDENDLIWRWSGREWERAERTFCKPCGKSVALAPSVERNREARLHMVRMREVWDKERR